MAAALALDSGVRGMPPRHTCRLWHCLHFGGSSREIDVGRRLGKIRLDCGNDNDFSCMTVARCNQARCVISNIHQFLSCALRTSPPEYHLSPAGLLQISTYRATSTSVELTKTGPRLSHRQDFCKIDMLKVHVHTWRATVLQFPAACAGYDIKFYRADSWFKVNIPAVHMNLPHGSGSGICRVAPAAREGIRRIYWTILLA